MAGGCRRLGLLEIIRSNCITYGSIEIDNEISDSEDSDYYPGRQSTDEESERIFNQKRRKKAMKRKNKLKYGKSSKRLKTGKEELDPTNPINIANGSHILGAFPPEILLRIFQYGAESCSPTRFLPNVSKVCREWNRVAADASMWRISDLSLENIVLDRNRAEKLLNYDLHLCVDLNLSGQTKIQSTAIVSILSKMPSLKNLDLTDCLNVKSETVKKIPELCHNIERLIISFTKSFNMNISLASVKNLICQLGPRLAELRLVRIEAIKSAATDILSLLVDKCGEKLETLDLRQPELLKSPMSSGIDCEIDISKFCKVCPNIQELRLDGLRCCDTSIEIIEGFPKLIMYSQGNHQQDVLAKNLFPRLFSVKHRLKHLDVSGSNIRLGCVCGNIEGVQHLVMSSMSLTNNAWYDVISCFHKWQHSLLSIDLSKTIISDNVFLTAFENLANIHGEASCPLEKINLSFTNVETAEVLVLLENCKHLKSIELTSCRQLPRGTKRLFYKHEFRHLVSMLRGDKITTDDKDISESSHSD